MSNLPVRKYRVIVQGNFSYMDQTFDIEAQKIIIGDEFTSLIEFNDEAPYLTFLSPNRLVKSIRLIDKE